MSQQQYDIQELPRPQPRREGGGKLLLVALLAVLMVGGAAFWLTRDSEQKAAIKARIATAVQDTPLAPVTKLFTPPPPPPPPSVVAPHTQPGTLAGQVVQGTVPSLENLAPTQDDQENTQPSPHIAPKVEEDSVVRMLFVEDIAQWMVARYTPNQDGGSIAWNLSGLNMRYGVNMRGFSYEGGDVIAGRGTLLRYVFNAPMLTALYALYSERFVEALGHAALEPNTGKALTPEQTDAMYKAYAQRFATLGGVLQGIASITDFSARMAGMVKLSQQIASLQAQMAEAVFALDEAREAAHAARIHAAQLRINGYNAQYTRLTGERTLALQNFVQAVRQANTQARGADEDTVLFMAAWVERRIQHDTHNMQTALVAARLLEDLAARLHKAGSGTR